MRQKILLSIAILSLTFAAASDAMSQWVQTNGPYGGEVSCFARMGTNKSPPILFAGAYDARGVFRSTDSGLTWKSVTQMFTGVNTLFTIGGNIIATSDDGAFLSTDSGESWVATPSLECGGGFVAVTGMITVGKKLFAANLGDAGEVSTFISSDSGRNWVDTGQPPGSIYSLAVIGGKIFASAGSGVYISTDTGLTWTASSNGLTGISIGDFGSGIAVIGDSSLFFFAADTFGTASKIFRSTDYGANWNALSTVLSEIVSRAIEVSDTTIYLGTDSGLYLSTNYGASWSSLGLANIYIISVNVIGSNILAGTLVGLYLTSNRGETWNLVGLPCTNIYSMALQGSNLIAGTSYIGHIYVSTNNGNSWTITSNDSENNGNGIQALFSYDGIIFESDYGGVQYSRDTGKTWEDPGNRWTNGLGNTSFSVIATDGKTLIAGSSDDEIFLSTDNGVTWHLCDSEFTNNNDNSDVLALAIQGDTIIAGSSTIGILISTNNGATWDVPNNGFTDTVVLALAVIGNDIFAATYPDGVYLSTNGGNKWKPANTGLENAYVYSFAVSGNKIFAGTDKGVFLSLNNGASWNSVSNGLPANFIHDLVINDSTLFAGTDSAGVWRRPLSEMINTSAVENAPSVQQSISAYPNPFSLSSTITFSCAESGAGEVTIVNLLGATVARMFSGELGAGEHSFSWDAINAPPGIYECVVRVNGSVQRIAIAHLSEP